MIVLTGYNSYGFEESCAIRDGAHKLTLLPFQNVNKNYDNATREVLPILTVYFPVANAERTSSISPADAQLACLRASTFSEGSRISPALPNGTAIRYGNGLSAGAVAGMLFGLLVWMVGWTGLGWAG